MEIAAEDLLDKLHKEAGQLHGVIAVFGEEDYFRSRILTAVPDAVFGGTDDADREITVFDKDTNLSQLTGVINTYPFFGGRSLVILRDEKLISPKQDNDSKKQQLAKLVEILADVPDYCAVVISVAKLDKRSRLYTSLKKQADALVCECKSVKPYNLAPWLDAQAKDLGGRLESDAVGTIMEYLAPVDNAPLALLRQELEKLAVYAGERKNWTRDDVETIFSALPEVSSFALLNAIAERRLPQVLELLAAERKKGTNILPMCGFILFQLRRMCRFKELQAQGYGQAQIASELKMAPFGVKKMIGQCCRFTADSITEAILAIAQLNIDLRKGGRQYPRLEEILVQLLS